MKEQEKNSMNDSVDQNRMGRFVFSGGMILWALFAVWKTAANQGISPVVALIGPIAYLVVASTLIALITGRLYAQHGIRKLKFDLGVIILVTFLAALPFALSNSIWHVYDLEQVSSIQANRTLFTCITSAIATFLLFPILIVTEALLAWFRLLSPFWPKDSEVRERSGSSE